MLKTHRMNFLLPRKLYRRLRVIAKVRNTSVSELIRRSIEHELLLYEDDIETKEREAAHEQS